MDTQESVIVESEPAYGFEMKDVMANDELEKNDFETRDDKFLLSTLCRLCTSPNGDDGRDIFGCDEIDQEINEMIRVVFPGKIHEEDGLTHFICLECIDKLRQCYEILVVFVEADSYFKNQLAELNEKDVQEESLVEDATSDSFYNENSNNLELCNSEEFLSSRRTTLHSLLRIENSNKKCSLCSKVFSSAQALAIHRRLTHKHCLATQRTNHYQCQKCPVAFTSLAALQLHVKYKYIKERNQSNIHVCQDCGLAFKRKYLLREHKRETHKKHICTSCGEAFFHSKALAIHTDKVHSNTTCSVCGKKFKTSYWRIMHEKTHETDNCHLCWVCGKVCISKSSLRTHMSLHYSSKSYTCEVCNKELKSASGLKHHKQIHTDRERIFKCNICEKAFTSKVILKQHGLSHSGLKPYACTNCGTQFNRLSNLNYHIKHYCSHKKTFKSQKNKKVLDPAYQCEICNSTFVSKLSFKYHLSRHTGNKNPFDCEECGVAFSSVNSYRLHKREHANDRPYICETCGKTFKTKATLNIHTSTHNNLYPYSCSECNRSFKRISSLKLHQSVHTGGKPYRCGICYRSFSRKGDAKTHLSRCHKVDIINGEPEEADFKYSEVVLDAKDPADFPVVAGEYVIQMSDDVEVETTYEAI